MTSFRQTNVLILGGLGFIGSNLALRLVKEGAQVTLVDSMLSKHGGNLANIEPVRGSVRVNFSDIRDQHSLRYIIRGAEVIFSVAGQTSHIESMTDPMTDLDINCRSQLAILEACREVNRDVRIIYASTRQLYGRPRYLPVDEEHPVNPVDVNGINKLAAENYYTLYSDIYDMHCVSLRLTNTYGPRQHLRDNKQGFAGIFIRKAISGERIQIFGSGKQLRDFNYVDDVAEAFRLATFRDDLKGGVFNLGNERRHTLLDFVDVLQSHCDFEWELVPFPPEHEAIDIGDYYGDYSRFHAKTGWKPEIDLDEGLRRTIEYFQPRRHLYW